MLRWVDGSREIYGTSCQHEVVVAGFEDTFMIGLKRLQLTVEAASK